MVRFCLICSLLLLVRLDHALSCDVILWCYLVMVSMLHVVWDVKYHVWMKHRFHSRNTHSSSRSGMLALPHDGSPNHCRYGICPPLSILHRQRREEEKSDREKKDKATKAYHPMVSPTTKHLGNDAIHYAREECFLVGFSTNCKSEFLLPYSSSAVLQHSYNF